jgi:hypothetical protein
MTSNAHLNIAPTFKREDATGLKGHPMRVQIKREHLLRREDNNPKRQRMMLIRDTVISVMGGISALVPMMIAIQSYTGV